MKGGNLAGRAVGSAGVAAGRRADLRKGRDTVMGMTALVTDR